MSWITVPLGKVTTVLSGTTPDSSNPAFWDGDSVWVTPTDLGKLNGHVVATSRRMITDLGRASCNLPRVPAGAVVMSSRAPIGHLAIAGYELHTNQGCKSFVCGGALDPWFLYFTLMHRKPEIQALGSGATFAEVSKSVLENFEIPFPEDLDDQRQVVARLKGQLVEVKTARQAAQVQWEDAQTLKSKALEAVFGGIGDWKPIGSVAKLQSGYAFKSDSFKRVGIRLLRNANILPGKVYWDDTVFLSEEDAQNYPGYVLSEGDVLISLDRPIISGGIKVARVRESDLPALLLQRVGRFILDTEQLDADYLYAYLQTGSFIAEVSGHEQSLGVPHISPSQVEAIEIPLPNIAIQRKLAERLNQITDAWTLTAGGLQIQLNDLSVLPQRLLAQGFEN